MFALRDELLRRGHEIDFYDPWKHRVEEYPIIHWFSCIETSTWKYLKRSGRRLVVTPTVRFPGPRVAARQRWKRKFGRWLDRERWAHLTLPDLWLPATEDEAKGLHRWWDVPMDRIQVLPNGADPRFSQADESLFRQKSGVRGPFVLHVGRVVPVKNHKTLIEAAGIAGIPCVFIGSPDPSQPGYLEECRKLAEKLGVKANFLPAVANDDPVLASAYAAASAFALPSEFETFGIAALEAAFAGAPLLLSNRMISQEIFREFATWLDPFDSNAWASALGEALRRGRPSALELDQRRQKLARFRWDSIAERLESYYTSIPSID